MRIPRPHSLGDLCVSAIDETWVIIPALAHNYERLKQVPSDESNGMA